MKTLSSLIVVALLASAGIARADCAADIIKVRDGLPRVTDQKKKDQIAEHLKTADFELTAERDEKECHDAIVKALKLLK